MVSAAERGQVLRAIITKGKKNLTGGGGLAATVQVLWQVAITSFSFFFFSWAARELVEQKVTRTKDPTKQAHPPPAPQSQHNPPQHLFAVCSVIYLCVFTRPPVLYTLCRPYGVHLCNSVDEWRRKSCFFLLYHVFHLLQMAPYSLSVVLYTLTGLKMQLLQ